MLFPLDDFDGIRNTLEERGELVPQEAVRLVLETVHLDGMLPVLLGEGTQAAHRAIRLFGCLDDDLAHGDAPIRGRLDLVQEKPIGDRVDEIGDVVEAARERIDVLAVDGRDKRGIEPPHHLVGDRAARRSRSRIW